MVCFLGLLILSNAVHLKLIMDQLLVEEIPVKELINQTLFKIFLQPRTILLICLVIGICFGGYLVLYSEQVGFYNSTFIAPILYAQVYTLHTTYINNLICIIIPARSVRDRWVNIRSTFNHNLRRVDKSKETATSTAEVYVPCWPLWKPLQFLRSVTHKEDGHEVNMNFLHVVISVNCIGALWSCICYVRHVCDQKWEIEVNLYLYFLMYVITGS